MEQKIYTPFLNCGWKHKVDFTCTHPGNATPECHQFICPISAVTPERELIDLGGGVKVDPVILAAILPDDDEE